MFSDSPPPTDPDSPQPETRPESNPSSPHFTAATNPGSVRCDQGDGECVGESADRVVVNLCSMYELAYVNHTDAKRTLNTWITRVAPDDFDSSCTRISGIVYMLFRSWIFPLSNVMITWMDILRSSTRSS
uniref:Uncharacterized protein n=1 Tax=Brassica campestris TaxID=3711 RepID=M4D5S2_BRACM